MRGLCTLQLGYLGPSATGIAQITAFGQHHSEGKISHKINELRMGEVLCNVQARDLFRYYAITCTFGYSFLVAMEGLGEVRDCILMIDNG